MGYANYTYYILDKCARQTMCTRTPSYYSTCAVLEVKSEIMHPIKRVVCKNHTLFLFVICRLF